jgi:hypothetical protein
MVKSLFQVLFVLMLLLSEASVFLQPYKVDAAPIVEGNTVRISLEDAYIEATPATLTASGWVDVTFWTRYYDGAVDVVYGFNGLDNVKAINPQVWESHIETKTRQATVTKTEEFIPEKVISTNTLAKAPVGVDLSLNTKYVEIVSEGIVTDNRTGLKTPITTKLAYDSYNASTGAYSVKSTSVGVEEYTESVTDYNERAQPVTNTLSYAGANKWDVAQYKTVVKNEVQKTRVWIDIPFGGVNTISGKYNIGIKPSSLTLQQAKDQGKLWLLDPWYSASWSYRKSITVTDKQDSYQTYVRIYKASGTDVPYLASEAALTADAGTNTTTIVDAALASSADNYYVGGTVTNSTHAGISIITAYVGATKTITMSPAITSQASGDSYAITKVPAAMYCNTHCQDDFDDLIFTKSDGTTKLDYWIESYTSGTVAWVWVESAAASETTQYLYYGNAGASAVSSGANTFIVFDDFERGVDGGTIGGSWAEIMDLVHISTEQKYGGTRSAKWVGAADRQQASIPVTASANIAVQYRYYKETAVDDFSALAGDGTIRFSSQLDASENINVFDGTDYVDTTLNCLADSWGVIEWHAWDWIAKTVKVKVDGVASAAMDFSWAGVSDVNVWRFTGALATQDVWIDNFLVRKWTATEPTWSSFGAESIPSCALTGTVTTAVESNIVAGGKTIVLTLTNSTWVDSGAVFNAIRDDIIAGMDSAQSEAVGWDAVYKANPAGVYDTDVVRTNDTVVTVTMSALATYSITADETITVTVPTAALVTTAALVASPTFVITNGIAGATVTTQAGSSVEATTATGNGNLTDDAGLTITERGICYSSVTNPPTIANSTSAAAGVGEGAYTAALAGLSTGTTYYLRAYVKSDEPATYYGSTVTILTKPAAPTGVSATDGTDTAKVVITWTKSTGATDYHVWRDAVDLGAAGDVATADDAGAAAPVITEGTASATDGTSSTEVTLSLVGASVANGTTHTYKVVASNATGNSADSSTNTGYRGHGALTYQWVVSAADSDAAYGNIGGGTTDPYSYTSAPAPTITAGNATASDATSGSHSVLTATSPPSAANGAGRYYKCVLDATGATQKTTAFNRGYRGTTTLTFAWQRSAADADAAFGAIGGGTTNPYNDVAAVIDPDGRWYYAVVSMLGAASDNTTHDRGNRSAFTAPTVVTGICSGSGTTWAGLNGMVTDQGDAAVSQYGFEYGLTTAYEIGDIVVAGNTANNVSYFMNKSTLTPSTIYHYRAKAFNTAWGYGADGIFATKGSPAINVNFNAGSDNCTAIWGVNVGAQTLTTSATTEYTVTSVRLEMLRVGLPGTVTVSIRRATAGAGNAPTGVDLTSGTINGNTLATSAAWYDIPMATQTTLELNSTYAIVVSAANGDVSNYVCWRKVNAGGFANGNADTSVNSGVTWTAQTWDNMFELWGNQALEIQDAKVFQSYKATDDWLVTVRYVNVYAPYYDTYDVKKYFTLQLVDAAGTVKASTVMPAWGNRVGSIYLSATTVSPLTYGGDYRVRIQGTFTGTPYTEYALVGSDWLGSDLTNLDSWILTSSTVIGTYYATSMTSYIAERGEVLNSTGAGVFNNGIAGLAQVRPAIFQTYTTPSVYTPGTITQAGRTAIPAWQTNVGPDATVMLTRVGNIVGIGGDIIAIIAFLIMMFILMALAFPAGNTTAAMVLSLPMLGAAIWFGMDLLYIGMLALIAGFLFVKNFWIDKGN